MLNTLGYLINFAFFIGMALLIGGAIGIKKVLKMNEKSNHDEELLTEKESALVGKYYIYIGIGGIFITIYYGLRILKLILKVD